MAKDTLKNKNTIEIIPVGRDATITTTDAGTDQEKKHFRFRGRVVKGKPTLVGQLKITSDQDEYRYINKNASALPDVSNIERGLGSNINLKLKSKNIDTRGLSVEHVYDIFYTAKGNSKGKNNTLKYSIPTTNRTWKKVNGESKRPATAGKYIYNVKYDKNNIDSKGGVRKFTVTGEPGASFDFVIMKYNDYIDENNKRLNYTESVVLDAQYLIQDLLDSEKVGHGVVVDKVYRGKIDSSGKKEFVQYFNKLDGSDNVRYSINIKAKSISKLESSRIKKQWERSPLGWDGWYRKDINQVISPIITFRIKTTSAGKDNMTINGTPITSARPYILKRIVTNNGAIKASETNFSVTYNLVITGHGLTIVNRAGVFPVGNIVFDNSGGNSSWANSDYNTNGGTLINISNIVRDDNIAGDATDVKADVKFDVVIEQLGSKHVTFDLDLSNHFTIS